ncbi:MAG: SUF system Fe-S cluster assembly protein [Lentimicrobiaceae bacterium]|nr:SUF system Fe-S cluster assembly protein [Lentimicrobiaceae bacterium]
MDKQILKSLVISALKTIHDPEIPVNIYDMGLIYEIKVNDDNSVYIKMTVTAPNCPVADSLPEEVRERVKSIEGLKDAEIELVFDPPWDSDMISEEAKLELGLL